MPINAGPEYYLAEERFLKAGTPEEKVFYLEEMIRALPKHKGTENVLAQLKRKLAKLKAQEGGAKKGAKSRGIEKSGDAQVCIFGKTNSGKSTLLKALTGKDVKISEKEFTTFKLEVGVLNLGGARIQLVEIPAKFTSPNVSLLYTCDLILVLYTNKLEKEELASLLKKRQLFRKALFAASKVDVCNIISNTKISAKTGEGLEELKAKIWGALGLIRVKTKTNNMVEEIPVVLKIGATVREFAKEIHKDFVENFAFARVFDKSQFSGRKVGLNYELKEGDIVEIHTN
ncbi:MAG: TGS domain-containing protein [Candidatus Aenigmatarchaeota archaeon]